jgi:pilus assembly protein FimV
LGELRVQSSLGQPFKGQIGLIGSDNGDLTQHCIKVKFETTEGVMLAPAQVSVLQSGQAKSILLLSRQSIPEPVVKVVVDIVCETQLHREFLILLDPPQFLSNQENISPVLLPQVGARIAAPGLPAATSSQLDGSKKVKRIKNTAGNLLDKDPISTQTLSQKNLAEVPPPAKPKLKKPASAPVDLLKLSDDSFQPQQGLKLSNTLSSSVELKLVENMVELRAAQVRMTAILRDEEPTQKDHLERSAARDKLQALQIETAQLKQQSLKNKRELDQLRESSYSRNWIVGLFAFALLALMAAVMLWVYLRRIQKAKDVSWWELAREGKDMDRRKNLEEIVDHIQASYEPDPNNPQASFENYHFEDDLSPQSGDTGASAAVAVSKETEAFFHSEQKPPRPLTLEETNSSVFNFFAPIGNSVNVEEISDVTQEAEFWMSVNDPQRAIEILEPQSNTDHPDSPVPWLYLLDLYGIVKDQNKYDQLRARFVANFNANIPEFSAEVDSESISLLENFPHLIARICSLWNSSEIIPFLQSLLIDDRDGKRAGFELPVYRDILLLISIAHELERVNAIEGMASGAKKPFAHHPGADASIEQPAKVDLGMIDFEVIDFPKDSTPKK